jgi:hypothetical protein
VEPPRQESEEEMAAREHLARRARIEEHRRVEEMAKGFEDDDIYIPNIKD